jgi:hypothetical protein
MDGNAILESLALPQEILAENGFNEKQSGNEVNTA